MGEIIHWGERWWDYLHHHESWLCKSPYMLTGKVTNIHLWFSQNNHTRSHTKQGNNTMELHSTSNFLTEFCCSGVPTCVLQWHYRSEFLILLKAVSASQSWHHCVVTRLQKQCEATLCSLAFLRSNPPKKWHIVTVCLQPSEADYLCLYGKKQKKKTMEPSSLSWPSVYLIGEDLSFKCPQN